MFTKVHFAMLLTVLGATAACSSSDDGDGGSDAGDASIFGNVEGGSDLPGDGDGDGDAIDASSTAGDGDGDSSDAGSTAGDGDSTDAGSNAEVEGGAVPGNEGIFMTANGNQTAFTVTPSAQMQFQGGGANAQPIRVTLTAGDSDGATAALTVGAMGTLTPGSYGCTMGQANTVQYIGPTLDTYQATGNVGACTVELTSVGAGVGDHVTGTFTATLEKQGGGQSSTLEITSGSFDIERTVN